MCIRDREIAGEDAEVKMLLKPGAEVHSYEPTPQDIIAIQKDVYKRQLQHQ